MYYYNLHIDPMVGIAKDKDHKILSELAVVLDKPVLLGRFLFVFVYTVRYSFPMRSILHFAIHRLDNFQYCILDVRKVEVLDMLVLSNHGI